MQPLGNADFKINTKGNFIMIIMIAQYSYAPINYTIYENNTSIQNNCIICKIVMSWPSYFTFASKNSKKKKAVKQLDYVPAWTNERAS